MDYPVANFGVDHDVLTNNNSLEIAEKYHTHKWKWQDTKPRKIVDYDTSKGLDVDMINSLRNLNE